MATDYTDYADYADTFEVILAVPSKSLVRVIRVIRGGFYIDFAMIRMTASLKRCGSSSSDPSASNA
jgi:hypothetical protein